MKICITARGPDLESGFEPHFARAPWYIFYDTRTRQIDAIRNGFVVNDRKMGQNAVQLLSLHRIATVITGKTGAQARNLLSNAKIPLHFCENEGTVNKVLEEFLVVKNRRPGKTAGGLPPKGHT